MKIVRAGLLLAITFPFGALQAAEPDAVPPTSPWEVEISAGMMSDYIWRGITQSAHKPAVEALTEVRYSVSNHWQLYAGISSESIDFPNQAALEIDVFAGVRPTVGPLSFDFGLVSYNYPGGRCFNSLQNQLLCNPSFANGNAAKAVAGYYEIYAETAWTLDPQWELGAELYYTPNIANTGSSGTYVSGRVKYSSPTAILNSINWYASAEIGEQFLGTSDAFYGTGVPGNPYQFGVRYADYLTWNAGLGFTWNVFTLDLRYSATSLSPGNCAVYTSANTAQFSAGAVSPVNPGGLVSNWCGSAFFARLAFELTVDRIK
jgi:uncharacterized protein (TIGR02001 family)